MDISHGVPTFLHVCTSVWRRSNISVWLWIVTVCVSQGGATTRSIFFADHIAGQYLHLHQFQHWTVAVGMTPSPTKASMPQEGSTEVEAWIDLAENHRFQFQTQMLNVLFWEFWVVKKVGLSSPLQPEEKIHKRENAGNTNRNFLLSLKEQGLFSNKLVAFFLFCASKSK